MTEPWLRAGGSGVLYRRYSLTLLRVSRGGRIRQEKSKILPFPLQKTYIQVAVHHKLRKVVTRGEQGRISSNFL